MRRTPQAHEGTLHSFRHEFETLRGNASGDPSVRDVTVWTPPGWNGTTPLALMCDLVGYTGTGRSHLNWKPFGLNLPDRLATLHQRGAIGEVMVVLPDCFTRFGGNQYLNSSAVGRYMDLLCDELVPLVESRFPSTGRRGVFGKSSGGYGAIVHWMSRPDVWMAAVCHSGDAYFEYVYQRDFPILLRQLAPHDGDPERYLASLHKKEKLVHDEIMGIMLLGMAASYDPIDAIPGRYHLPFDAHTGEVASERWAAWLEHDPVRMLDARGATLPRRGLFVDCGRKDQYMLLYGARMLHERLTRYGVEHVYEEFDDDHSDIDYRMDVSLPWLFRELAVPK
ncbi:MAG: enterochelin esterase [Myxococcales bacterium]|nr:enterochelin esterase [Myxococcales bacterium]